MIQPLRTRRGAPAFSIYLLALPLVLTASAAGAQSCPAAPGACAPGSAPGSNYPYGMGILKVTLGAINNTTLGVAEGYKDYSCAQSAALTVGTNIPVSVRTNANSAETVRVWLDLNNDGAFNTTSELIYGATATGIHAGTIQLPVTATLGTSLRLRVAADYVNSPVPTPCSTPQYSQTEDYSVTLSANMATPTADFTADQPLTCSGCVRFADQSQNAPTSWAWTFGDGTTSNQQNPQHCYTTPGTFTVALTATNAIGTNTRTRTSYVTYDNVVPKPASCTPITTAYCCGYGITQFTLGPLTKASGNGQAGYEDFTCGGKVQLTEGKNYALSVTTSPTNPQDTRVWLDLNNDGVFNATTELVFQALNKTNPSGTYTVPVTAVRNQPLRLRVASDFVGSDFGPCSNLAYGQAEDYTVTVLPNFQPPVAAFTSNYALGGCQNPVQFTDLSQNAPTTWLWNFGDGTTSNQQSPAHTYAASGSYTVALTATNAYGNNTTQSANYAVVTVPCLPYCASTGSNASFWITSVSVTGAALPTPFASTSGADPNGYGNYLNRTLRLAPGQIYTLTVTSNAAYNRTTSVWIDWNRDGVFATTELIVNANATANFNGALMVPSQTGTVGFTRMRVIARLNTNTASACLTNQANSETEDYSVLIAQPTPTTEASRLPALTIFPNPTTDGRLHLRLTDANAAGTYAASVENVLGARVLTSTLRLSPAADADLDLTALPRGLYLVCLQSSNGQTAVRRVVRN